MIVNLKAGKCKSKCIPPERRKESATTGVKKIASHCVNIGILGKKEADVRGKKTEMTPV